MKYRRYAEYKDSGVEWLGKVPAHWCIRRAKHVSTVFVPQSNKPELNAFGGHYWLTMDDMVGAEILSTHNYVSDDAAAAAGSRILPAGSVIASCVGTFAVAAINRVPAIINQQLQAYIPSGIKPEYLRYVVTISESYFLRAATTATIEYINQEKFGDLPLPLPSTSEQSAITTFLDRETTRIDALIAKQERLIAVLQEKRQALISHAVTKGLNPAAPMKDSGVEWLGEVPAHWEVRRNKSIYKEIDDRSTTGEEELL